MKLDAYGNDHVIALYDSDLLPPGHGCRLLTGIPDKTESFDHGELGTQKFLSSLWLINVLNNGNGHRPGQV